jgi:hypothetical protein
MERAVLYDSGRASIFDVGFRVFIGLFEMAKLDRPSSIVVCRVQ